MAKMNLLGVLKALFALCLIVSTGIIVNTLEVASDFPFHSGEALSNTHSLSHNMARAGSPCCLARSQIRVSPCQRDSQRSILQYAHHARLLPHSRDDPRKILHCCHMACRAGA